MPYLGPKTLNNTWSIEKKSGHSSRTKMARSTEHPKSNEITFQKCKLWVEPCHNHEQEFVSLGFSHSI